MVIMLQTHLKGAIGRVALAWAKLFALRAQTIFRSWAMTSLQITIAVPIEKLSGLAISGVSERSPLSRPYEIRPLASRLSLPVPRPLGLAVRGTLAMWPFRSLVKVNGPYVDRNHERKAVGAALPVAFSRASDLRRSVIRGYAVLPCCRKPDMDERHLDASS